MQYICLTIRYIAKQKRSKKQHLVAPKFAQNLFFCPITRWMLIQNLFFENFKKFHFFVLYVIEALYNRLIRAAAHTIINLRQGRNG